MTSKHVHTEWRRVILIAGHPRGGTTWVGKTLGFAENAFYINEPLTYRFHDKSGSEPELSGFFRSPWWRLGGPGRELAELSSAFLAHMDSLSKSCQARGDKVLLVKVPTTESIEFFVRLLRPDMVIYIRRNAMAVFNSYHKAWLYRGWKVAEEWRRMLRDTDSDVSYLCSRLGAKKWIGERERILGMATLRYALIERLPIENLQIRDYEAVAKSPLREFKSLFEISGLRWSASIEERIKVNLTDHRGEGFDSTEKNSMARISGWIRELPFWEVSRGMRFLHEIGYGGYHESSVVPRPGLVDKVHGLSVWPRRIAWRLYVLTRASIGAFWKRTRHSNR